MCVEVYNGKVKMPMVRHPYYTACTDLILSFRLNQDGHNHVQGKKKMNEVDYLFEDLF